MKSDKISALRTENQLISQSGFDTAEELTAWMGAIQAQDYYMVKWAFGLRLPGTTLQSINNEIDSGKIIRTHVLRPTWHFVSSEDVYWMTGISASRIGSALAVRDQHLGLDKALLKKCSIAIEKVLRDDQHLTRDELFAAITETGLKLEREQASHIFVRAEVEGIICSGRQKKGKPTYALLNEWVPENKKKYKRDESLKELAHKYFVSRGPATVQDFAWWSGLSLTEARTGLEHNKSFLISEKIQDQTYWFANSVAEHVRGNNIFLLPAYDEFLISYRDRSAVITHTDQKTAVSNNGIFYPVILSDNHIAGTWKRKEEKGGISVSISLFQKGSKLNEKKLLNAVKRYSEFFGRKTELY